MQPTNGPKLEAVHVNGRSGAMREETLAEWEAEVRRQALLADEAATPDPAAMPSLRADLSRAALRWVTPTGALFLGAGIVYLAATSQWANVPLLGVALMLLFVGSWAKLPLVWRLSLTTSVYLLGGLVDLLVYGWGGSAALIFLGATIYAALGFQAMVSWGVFIMTGLITLGSVLVERSGAFQPLFSGRSVGPWGDSLWAWVIFAVLGAGCVGGCRWLFTHATHLINEERRKTNAVSERQERMQQRVTILQEANTGLQRRATYLEGRAAVAKVLTNVFELDVLLNRAAELIAEQFGFHHVGIFLMDEMEAAAVLRAASSTAGKEMVLHAFRVARAADTIVGQVAEERRPHVVDRIDMHDAQPSDGRLPATCSRMVLPLLLNDELLGLLDFQSREETAFEPNDLHVLSGLADHVALTIHRARRLRGEAAVLEAASPFYRTTHRLAAARTERQIYETILEAVRNFGVAHTFIVQGTEPSTALHVVAHQEGDQVGFVRQNVAGLSWPGLLDVVIMGMGLSSPLWIEDLADLPPDLNPELAGALSDLQGGGDIAALAFVPILREMPRGEDGIFMLYAAPHRFTELEQRMHQLLAELGGVALERSQVQAQAQAHLERERLIATVGERIRASTSVETILQRSIYELAVLLESSEGEIWLQSSYRPQTHPDTSVASEDWPTGDPAVADGVSIEAAWDQRMRSYPNLAYRYTGVDVEPADLTSHTPLPAQAEFVALPDGGCEIRAPIVIRKTPLGLLALRQEQEAVPWGDGEVRLVADLCAQIGLTLENAWLLDEAQVSVSFEQMTHEVAERIRASATDVDRVLQTTLRELSRTLHARGSIRLRAFDAWHPVNGDGDTPGRGAQAEAGDEASGATYEESRP